MKDSFATRDILSIIKTNIGVMRSFVPTQLAIETVRACNARCIMCPSSTMKREKGVMSDETHQIILKNYLIGRRRYRLSRTPDLGSPFWIKISKKKLKNEKRYSLTLK